MCAVAKRCAMNRYLALVAALFATASVAAETYSFGVLPQRSPALTAQYWNPILDYVGRKAGIVLELVTRKSSLEYSEAEARGEFDFVYNNHIFAPSHAAAGYRVLVRSAGEAIRGQIVVPEPSPIRSLRDLEGREVAFPSKNAFVAYAAPMSAFIDARVTIVPVFGANQEGVMAQLRAGKVQAAGVNSRVMREYAIREGFKYLAIWTSEAFLEIPVAVHPRVRAEVARQVREALIRMSSEAEGQKVLAASAEVVKQPPPWGFLAARDEDYRNQREIYRAIWRKEGRGE